MGETIARHINSLSKNDQRCYPFKYAKTVWPGHVYCKCPNKKSLIKIDVPRKFPGPAFWGGPNWRRDVLDTPAKRQAACQRTQRWDGMTIGQKLKEAFDPSTQVGKDVAIYKDAFRTAKKILGPASVIFPPLAVVEAAVLTGEKGVDAVGKFIREF